MATNNDTAMRQRIRGMFDRARLPLDVDVNDGIARVTGYVDSQAEYQAAIDILSSVDGLSEVVNEIEVSTNAPDSAFQEASYEEGFEFAENPAWGSEDDVEYEPDLASDLDAETSDFQKAVEEGQPYFPPTDPVVRPVHDQQDFEVTGGFQNTSMDELADEPQLDSEEEDAPGAAAGRRDDETLRDDIYRELSEDAATTGLDLEIEVVNGVVLIRGEVQSLDDSLNVEDVAGRVPGIVEVRDETTIQQ